MIFRMLVTWWSPAIWVAGFVTIALMIILGPCTARASEDVQIRWLNPNDWEPEVVAQVWPQRFYWPLGGVPVKDISKTWQMYNGESQWVYTGTVTLFEDWGCADVEISYFNTWPHSNGITALTLRSDWSNFVVRGDCLLVPVVPVPEPSIMALLWQLFAFLWLR